MKIFVTGAGALLGQGILRSLRLADRGYEIITGDPSVLSSGHWLGDKGYIIPKATDINYRAAIEKVILQEKIDVLLIGTDVELPFYAVNKEQIEASTGVKIVVASSEVIDIANDKWLTAKFLQENSFPYPKSALTKDVNAVNKLVEQCGFPLIAKPVDGARSIGFEVIRDRARLDHLLSYPNNLVIQEHLSDENGEFTSGCVVFNGECKAIVSLRRDLRDGNTYRTYRDKDTTKYDETVKQVAEKLGIEGPCNFQFRIKNGEPIIFEINSRFSGTTPLRNFYGFNEVDAVLQYVANGQEISQPQLKEGTVMRAWADILIENDELNSFTQAGVLNKPQSSYFPFKD